MAELFMRVFSLRHLLVLSLALNVSLLFRALTDLNKGTNEYSVAKNYQVGGDGSAHVEATGSQRSHLAASSSYSSSSSSSLTDNGGEEDQIISLDHGDPTMYQRFWQQVGDKSTVVIPGWQSISYFSDIANLCWFLEPEFAREVIRLHKIVGNAVTEDRHIVVGTGSTQLFQAVLYALSKDAVKPISVVSAAPYYSSYPAITDCLKSGLYKWAGDARKFNEDGPFIELVTSPNNPDGYARQAVVNRSGGMLVHDLAYYWPQYTPISSPADHDIMLFTVSKTTGHAGTRLGWALVKDQEVAKKMVKFIELTTIGVSKDSQQRAAKIVKVVANGCESLSAEGSFFEFGYQVMAERWLLLRQAAAQSGLFSLPEFSPGFCRFLNRPFEPQPAFAWLKCGDVIEDCEHFLRGHKILTRSGTQFGMNPQYVRISILDRDETFYSFIKRLSSINPN